jgi:hypothetical protein
MHLLTILQEHKHKQHTKTLLKHLRTTIGTNNWSWHTILKLRARSHLSANSLLPKLKAKSQLSANSLHKFAVVTEKPTKWSLCRLPQHYTQTGTACAFLDRIRGYEILHILMGSNRMLNLVLSHALRLQATKVAAE